MDAKKTSLKTLIGLPVVLLVAGGVAFGAARLSDALSTQSANTLTAEESESATTVDESIPLAEVAKEYNNTVAELSATMQPRYALRSQIPGEINMNASSVTVMARAVLDTICWMLDEDPQATKLPVGPVQDSFFSLLNSTDKVSNGVRACDFPSEQQKQEAGSAYTLDDDSDGLSFPVEIWYGTNLLKPDTDGDGFLDVEEITNGYSPLKAE